MYVKGFSRVAAGAAVAVALGVGLSACGSHSSNSGGGGAGSGGDSSGSVVIQSGQGARLTGTYSALDIFGWVPASMYPSDITGASGGMFNTNSVVRVNSKYDLASVSCSDLLVNTGGPGFGEEAYLIDQGQNSAHTAYYAYAVYEFPTADQATGYVKGMAAAFGRCSSFSAQSSSGGSLQVTMGAGSRSEENIPAADAVVDLRQSATNGGKTVAGDLVVSADGNIVLVESATSTTGSVPTEVNLDSLSQQMFTAFATQEAKWVSGHVPSDYTTSTAAPSLPPADRIAGGDAR